MTNQEIIGVRPVLAPAKPYGPYGWITPHIAAFATTDKAFAARVLMIPREEQHFIALLITAMGDKADDKEHMTSLARDYHRQSRRALFANYAPTHATGIMKFAPKLKGDAWETGSYRLLLGVFTDPQARKTLSHMPQIKRSHVNRLAQLPEGFRSGTVLKKARKKNRVDEINFAIGAVRRIRTELDDRAILASFSKRDCSIRDWMMQHYETAPFPPAPVGEIEICTNLKLVPLENFKTLAISAREFSNCIRTYLYSVLLGDSYFYRYGPPAVRGAKLGSAEPTGMAIVELRRVPVIGWVIHEALGPKNNPIKQNDREVIIQAFSRREIGAAPQAVNTKAWINLS